MTEYQVFEKLKQMKREQEKKDKQQQIDNLDYPFTPQQIIDYLSTLPLNQAWEYWESLEKANKDLNILEALEFLQNRDNLPQLIFLFARMMAQYGITWEYDTLIRVFGESYPQQHLHQALNKQEIIFLQQHPEWLLMRPYPQFSPIIRADLINRLLIKCQKGIIKTDTKQFHHFITECSRDSHIRKWIDKRKFLCNNWRVFINRTRKCQ